MAAINKIVLVGHCGADQYALTQAVERALGDDVAIESANTADELGRAVSAEALLLVNRQLDGRFDTGSGIELIRGLAGDAGGSVMMLISNYPEAQDEAVAAGAMQGFGKSNLSDAATAQLLRDAVRQG